MSKTNLKLTKPSYIVKKEEGVVVCKIEAQGTEFWNTLYFDYYKMKNKLRRLDIKGIDDPLIFTAVAKLNPGDTWDETLGKRIAESKCKRAIFRTYTKVMQEYENALKDELTRTINVRNNIGMAMGKEGHHLMELIGKEK